MDAVVQNGVHARRWGAHCGSCGLKPMGVAKLEHVVAHDNTKCVNDWFSGDVTAIWRVTEEIRDDGEGVISIDVGVHGHGVNGEKAGFRCIYR